MGCSHWCSSKPDKTNVCICVGLKRTVNPVLTLDKFSIPKVEDLLSTLAGDKIFSKIDFSHAYQQLTLSDESKQYVIINTQKDLFHYTYLSSLQKDQLAMLLVHCLKQKRTTAK